MPHTQHDSYLESRVLTAQPQRLHLMLIEGALRFGRQAEQALRAGDIATAGAPLLRTIDIVGELLAGVRAGKSEINKKLADFYLFLFRAVSLAKVNNDVEQLAEALRLLEYERQTWQLVCDKLASDAPTDAGPWAAGNDFPGPVAPFSNGLNSPLSGSFSLEA